MDQALEHISKKLKDRELDLIGVVSQGGCKSFEDYRELCGLIRGLQTAQFEIGDLNRKMKENDD